MGKSLNSWLSKPVFIYTFGLFFLIYKTAGFFPSFDISVFLLLLCAYCAINFLIILVLKKTGLYRFGIGWLLIVWTLLLFTLPILSFLGKFIPPSYVHFKYLLIAAVLVCFVLVTSVSKISAQKLMLFNRGLNAFILILTALTLLSGSNTYRHELGHNKYLEAKRYPAFKSGNKSDIIWILMDEYGSPSSLKSLPGFNNSFGDSLRSKKFFVFDSLSTRNDTTVYSINSLFNLDDSIPVPNFNYATAYLNKGRWVSHLKENGYDLVNLDFLNIGGHPKFSYLSIFPDDYLDQILFNTSSIFLREKFEKNLPFDSYNQHVIKTLISEAQKKRAKPALIWAHLLIPHAPFYRNRNGDINKAPIIDPEKSPLDEVKKQYTDYLLYGDAVILKIIAQIPDWQKKTIIITGDHGARMLFPVHDVRRKSTFGAIYYPGMDEKELANIKYLQQIPFHLH